jgi:hypothetical protein
LAEMQFFGGFGNRFSPHYHAKGSQVVEMHPDTPFAIH